MPLCLRAPTQKLAVSARDDAVLELEHRDVEVRRDRGERRRRRVASRSGWSVVANAVTRRAGPNIAVRIVSG